MKNNKYKKQSLNKTRKIKEGKKSKNKKPPKYYKSKNILSKKLNKKTKIRSIKYKKKAMINLERGCKRNERGRSRQRGGGPSRLDDLLNRYIMCDSSDSEDELSPQPSRRARSRSPSPTPTGARAGDPCVRHRLRTTVTEIINKLRIIRTIKEGAMDKMLDKMLDDMSADESIEICLMAHGTMPSDDVEPQNAKFRIPNKCRILFSSVGIGYLMEQLCVKDKAFKKYFETFGIKSLDPTSAAAGYKFNRYLREYSANTEFPNLTIQFDSADRTSGIWGIYLRANGKTISVNGKGAPGKPTLCSGVNYNPDMHDYSLKNIVEKISNKYRNSDITFLVITCSEFHYGNAYSEVRINKLFDEDGVFGKSSYQIEHSTLLRAGNPAKIILPFDPNFIAQELKDTKLKYVLGGNDWFKYHGPDATQLPPCY